MALVRRLTHATPRHAAPGLKVEFIRQWDWARASLLVFLTPLVALLVGLSVPNQLLRRCACVCALLLTQKAMQELGGGEGKVSDWWQQQY